MNTVERLIDKCGGVQRLADYAGRSRTRVWEWKQKGQAPLKVWPEIIENAAHDGINLTYQDFLPEPAE